MLNASKNCFGPGLRERIAAAKTINELEKLVSFGQGFRYASPKTTRSWHRTTAKRRAYLVEVGTRPEKLRVPVRKNSEANT